MKKILTSALMIALSFGVAQAQDSTRHKGGKHGDKARHEMGYRKADLSADQQAKIKAINESYRDKMKALKDQTALTEAERKTKRESLHQQHKAELDAVLTTDQRAKAGSYKHDGKGKKAHHKGGDKVKANKGTDVKAGRGSNEDMAKELNLTTEQQAKLETIRTENKVKLDAIRNDASLTKEQKRSKMEEIMKAQKDQMRSLLTPEQAQKMKQERKSRPAQTKKK